MNGIIHALTGPPGPWTAVTIVCGAVDAALATRDTTLVTCPSCQPGGNLEPSRGQKNPFPAGMTEKALQEAVRRLAVSHGWMSYHTMDSRRSPSGFPDIIALKGNRCLVLELKSATGLLTPAQQTWLAAWRHILGAEVHVVRPADLDTIVEVFR